MTINEKRIKERLANAKREQEAFDALPDSIREALREHHLPINPIPVAADVELWGEKRILTALKTGVPPEEQMPDA